MTDATVETRLALLEQKTIDMMQKFIDHMENEEETQKKNEKMLSEIYEILRNQQVAATNDGKELKKEILDHVEKYYATKTDVETMNTKVESSRTFAIGASTGISIIIALIGLYISLKGG